MISQLIAREGNKSIVISLIFTIVFSVVDLEFLAFAFLALTLWFIFVYRNKKIKKDYDISDILCPVSGVISSIDKKDNKSLVFIDVSLFDNHIIRAPKSGNFIFKQQKGVHTLLDSLKARKLNEKTTLQYSDLKVEFISSLFSNDISIDTKEALMGDKLGVFLHGQVIIEIDSSKELLTSIGKKVQAGKTVIARAK